MCSGGVSEGGPVTVCECVSLPSCVLSGEGEVLECGRASGLSGGSRHRHKYSRQDLRWLGTLGLTAPWN